MPTSYGSLDAAFEAVTLELEKERAWRVSLEARILALALAVDPCPNCGSEACKLASDELEAQGFTFLATPEEGSRRMGVWLPLDGP